MRFFAACLMLLNTTLVYATPFTAVAPKASLETSFSLAVPTPPGTGLHRPTPVASLTRPTGSGCQKNTTTTYSLPIPKVTVPPAAGGVFFEPGSEAEAAGVAAKFRQTTYYTCVTWPSTVHCGWHEPILDASMDAAWSQYDSRRAAIWSVIVAAAVLVVVTGT